MEADIALPAEGRAGLDRFGVSAPAKDAYDYFGLTPGKIAERVTDFMKTREIA